MALEGHFDSKAELVLSPTECIFSKPGSGFCWFSLCLLSVQRLLPLDLSAAERGGQISDCPSGSPPYN